MYDSVTNPIESENLRRCVTSIKSQYENVYLIISPPRCASTAVARTFWTFPSVNAYSHEPFESNYYNHTGIDCVISKLTNPILIGTSDYENNSSMVIKEMTFQVSDYFEDFATVSNNPLLFLIRNPLLSIQSRYSKKNEGGQPINFPLRENGWDDLYNLVCKSSQLKLPFYIMDTTDFRSNPVKSVQLLCGIYNIDYSSRMLEWSDMSNITLDNLGGQNDHLYARVLSSEGILPPTEVVPSIDDFSSDYGIKDYVQKACSIYNTLHDYPQLLRLQ